MVDVDTARLMLSKAFEPLPAFNANDRVITVTGLSRASGLPKSTVYRMVEPGAIGHHRTGYKVGIELFRLGVKIPAAGMRDVALPGCTAQHERTACATLPLNRRL